MRLFFILFLFCRLNLLAQTIHIEVIDVQNNTRIQEATAIFQNQLYKSQNGIIHINLSSYPSQVIVRAPFYVSDTLQIQQASVDQLFRVALQVQIKDKKTVVVSAGKRRQAIEEIPVSMEILRPELIDNKGITDLEQAVDQTPGVYTMDGQVSIRGGSGFAYGTGSRVLLLWNGMPLLSGYAGDTQWNEWHAALVWLRR